MKLEFWTEMGPRPRDAARFAERAEQVGWDGIAVYDSQNLNGDCYVALALAAVATDRLGLSTGVTNSVTRHPSITACAIASIQEVSGGRAVLGIGRGDSALAHIGHAPGYTGAFEDYLKAVQTYLSGGGVAFDELKFSEQVAPSVDTLVLADTPDDSRLHWLTAEDKKVPVEVAATGPRVIAGAARHADHIMFALGAEPERVRWGLEEARRARREAGLDPNEIKFGVYLNVVCHPRIEVARELVGRGLATFARFSVMHGTISGPVSQSEQKVLTEIHQSFNMRDHDRNTSVGPSEFVDRFAIVGPPDTCIRRIEEIANLGIEKVVVMGGMTPGGDNIEAARAEELLAQEVLPAFAT